ncbi:PREDICTED: dehydrogenase/reductase SDR family member 11-like [Vollenhovia emeryi]|uniref:dehydrogenase/reductase SDR family member 11-like n=1 Tax=Vollenhovia emeryi TaxID=411798 RepID=UPI0005F38B26|nr:PREDICTED: dehydrogenase/reductase SDR family member 11-like [Vollenhovia emeryi]
MERWAGKVAVVTGASAGIGAAIARSFVKQGMIVAGFARRVEKVKEIADSLKDSSGKLYPVECDVTEEESVAAAFARVKGNLGPISVLVNSAGIIKESSLIDGTLEDWRSVFDVNVLGLCLCTREAVRMMRETAAEDAVVIHVNSLAAERVPFVPGFSVYPASKRAITGLAMTLRHELAGTRIRVTNISPGLVATEFMASYSTFSPEAMVAAPTLSPDDVAAAAVYVLSNPSHVLCKAFGMNIMSNKIAVVTGACSEIGKAIVEELVLKGLKVIGLSSDINKLKILVDELKGKPGKLCPLQCDLSIPNEIEAASEWIEKNVGSVDILINNASISLNWSGINGGIQELKKTLDINVLGLSYITKKILQLMKNKGIDNGCIVNVNDICGLKWLPLASDRPISPAYACSKSALTALTDCLRLELAQNQSNIKVISICPGLVETEITQQWLKENSRLALKPKDVVDAILYSLQTPENVLIKDLIITPIREII